MFRQLRRQVRHFPPIEPDYQQMPLSNGYQPQLPPTQNPRTIRINHYFTSQVRADMFRVFLGSANAERPLCPLRVTPHGIVSFDPSDERDFNLFERRLYNQRGVEWHKNCDITKKAAAILTSAGRCVTDGRDWERFRFSCVHVIFFYLKAYMKPRLLDEQKIIQFCEGEAKFFKAEYKRKRKIPCTAEGARLRKEMKHWMKLVLNEFNKISHQFSQFYALYPNTPDDRAKNRERW